MSGLPTRSHRAGSVGPRNPTGLEELYVVFSTPMLRYARRQLGDTGAGEDAVHTVFLSALHAGVGSSRVHTGAGRYLFSALRNECHRQLKRRKRLALVDMATLENLPIAVRIAGSQAAREEAARDRTRWLLRALCELSPQCATVLDYRLQGYSYREIAGLLSISPNTVHVHLQRAKTLLREQWKRSEREREQ